MYLESIYHKSQQVYTEKEIIALAAKAGVNANSIPDVHQSLVDDALVEKEKIGGSNYSWSFKAKKDRMAQKQHEQTLQVIQDLKPKVEEASAKLADAKRGREETPEEEEGGGGETRAKKLARLSELAKRKVQIESELDSLKENDPAALADLEKELKLVTGAAHRWTDNIFECKSYLVKKRGMEKKEAMRILGVTANFDCKYCLNAVIGRWLGLSILTLAISLCFQIQRTSSGQAPSWKSLLIP
jgi:DNA-binding transcriptional regulator YhcF (GntR family)